MQYSSVIVTGCLTAALVLQSTIADAANEVVLFPYFLDNGDSGVYLAESDDGRTFELLNDARPIFTPPKWPDGQHLTRDPSIVFHDGLFHMVWTSNWSGRVFGYASSPDLITWSTPQQVTPFPASLAAEEQPDNVWAPEIHRPGARELSDPLFKHGAARRVRRRRQRDRHQTDHRLYEVRTTDFKTFTPAKVLVDQDFSVIDGQIAYDDRGTPADEDDRWVMALKREDAPPRGKNIRLAFRNAAQNDDKTDDWSPVTEPILGPGSTLRPNQQVEGPGLVRFGGQWLLYADAFTSGNYSLIASPDLKTWTDDTANLKLPVRHPRHGTPFVVDRQFIGWKLD